MEGEKKPEVNKGHSR